MSDEPKDELKKDAHVPEVKTEATGESLPESELQQVAGGKPNLSDITIMKVVDKSSPL
jgi:type VI protein secretion system component Hcp